MTTAWPEVGLGDCCDIISGATPSTTDPSLWDGDVNWATPKDLSDLDGLYISATPRRLTSMGLRSCSASVLPPRSVLFSSRAPIGHVAINTVPMATNQGFKSLVPHAGLVHAEYLAYWLRCNRPFLESLGNGATFKELSKATVERVSIPLPPIEEQRRIAAILDKADDLRAKRRAALAQLDTLTEAIFIDMLGDPGGNEREWPLVGFQSVAPSRLGKMLDQKRQTGAHARPYLRNANVQWGRIDLSDVAEMDFDAGDRAEYRLQPGDLLICEGGEPGRAAIWRGELEECYFQKALHRVRPQLERVTAEYLLHLLSVLAHRGHLVGSISTATIAHLTGERLKVLQIPLPPVELQREFTRRAAAVSDSAAQWMRSREVADELFGALQQRAFAGTL